MPPVRSRYTRNDIIITKVVIQKLPMNLSDCSLHGTVFEPDVPIESDSTSFHMVLSVHTVSGDEKKNQDKLCSVLPLIISRYENCRLLLGH